MKLSAVLICRDEEKNIGECLTGLAFCDERIVVDSGSRDQTVRLAEAAGTKVFFRAFSDFADQKNFAISKASGEWVLLVDADERVPEVLATEIVGAINGSIYDGYWLERRNQIFGRWMRHGAYKGDRQLRLIRRDKAVFEGPVHERVRVSNAGQLKEPLLHHSTPDIVSYMRKLNTYTDLEAKVLMGREGVDPVKRMKRRPVMVFAKQMVFYAGFLDGLEGFLFGVLSAYYEFIRYAKYWENRIHAKS